jgi:hypothetical protein
LPYLELSGQRVDIEFQNIVPKKWILPTVELTLRRTSRRIETEPERDYVITNLNLQLSIKDEHSNMTIGCAKSASLQETWPIKPPEDVSDLIFELTFDNYTLSQIEKIRKGNNLPLFIRLTFLAFPVDAPLDIRQYKSMTIEKEIPKSTWVEEILPGLNMTDANAQQREYWAMLDKQFQDIIEAGKQAFVLNKFINVIVVSVGVILIASSILQTWFGHKSDVWNTLTSGIGVGSFVIVFFNKPQSNINKAVASLASLSIIYKGHKLEYETINDALFGLHNAEGSIEDTEEMTKLNKALEDSTKRYVELLHDHLEVFSEETSKQKIKQKGNKS